MAYNNERLKKVHVSKSNGLLREDYRSSAFHPELGPQRTYGDNSKKEILKSILIGGNTKYTTGLT